MIVAAEVVSEAPSLLTIMAEALFVVGVIGVVAAGLSSTILGRGAARSTHLIGVGGWVVAALGALTVAGQHRTAVGASISGFVATPLGDAAVLRLLGLAAAYPGVALLGRAPRSAAPGWLAVAGVGVGVLGHAAAGHAAATTAPRLTELVQAMHVGAVAVWAGGLVAVLVARRSMPPAARTELWWRFARVAFGAFATLAVTGAARALGEAGSLEAFARSTYGRIVLVKLNLLVVLGILAARNRWWHLPRGAAAEPAVHRAGRVEIAIAAAAVALSGWLSQEPPPRHAGHAGHVTAAGADQHDHGDPAGSAGGCARPVDGVVRLVASERRFSTGCIEVEAGTAFTIRLDNRDAEPHDVAVFAGAAHPQPGDEPIVRGELFAGPASRDHEVPPLEPGTYHFHCDAHPAMGGVIQVGS